MKKQADIGLIGLAVMGENLVLNMESHGYTIAVFNRSLDKVDSFIQGRGKDRNIIGTHSIQELVGALKSPRKVMLLVKAGKPVDEFIEMLLPYLEKGDMIIDGGNTHYGDTNRRCRYVESKGLLYIGTGVSGGEEGALKGPSIMPGGSRAAWDRIRPVFQDISAKVADGSPCCEWVGDEGAGHFVKMVHNGIEYGDMQLISEAYHLMRDLLKMSHADMFQTFAHWNQGDLDSYLIEITRDIMNFKDEQGDILLEKILDAAGQKGTGKWTVNSALELGVPLTLIGESVFARSLSSLKDERVVASKILPRSKVNFKGEKDIFLADLQQALFASKIISYAQGYALMKAAAKEFNWNLDFGAIALMWRGGCIIRSVFLERISEVFNQHSDINNLLLAPFFRDKIEQAEEGWRRVTAAAILNGIPVPALSAAITYYDGYRSENLPANLLQAQRDFFGAHTYERTDSPRGEYFHTNWTGRGGETASTSYNV